MSEKTSGVNEGAPLVRAKAAKTVTVHRPMVFGGQLVNTLDYVVLLHVLFAIADGEENLTVPKVWRQLQEQGIRSAKNDQILVGRDAVYKAFARLIAAGYVHFEQEVEVLENGSKRKGKAVYKVFEDPQDNSAWKAASVEAAAASSQVSPLPGCREAGNSHDGHSGVSAGQPASRVPGYGNPASRHPGSGKPRVPAGQPASRVSGSGELPPHTPGGGKTPPTPHVTPVPSVPSERRTGRGRVRSANNDHGFPPEAIEAAMEFLAELPMPFACGLADQRKHAPLLLETVQRQGWELGPELARALTHKSATGLDSPTRALKARFGELPRRSVVLRDSAPADTAPGPENPCPDHPRLEASGCPQCAADHQVDRQRRTLDAERGIDDESARAALAALIQRGKKPRTAADRGRDAAARQAEEARRQSGRRAEFLAG
ncbi:hypothetical protein [Streptomyces sp. CBMA156]|uniref:hypothetical protein n=1 Tax=Streptomyces sp. CBMA156 TaxID=1930280 RepID=UPI0016619AF8|nr:hypothetical protein [Streptomyces sp. CBMA156]MBD0671638.1 hypothetical protein [Streptomyces sp. CBMA156]